MSCIITYSFESQSSQVQLDYFKSHLLAQHSKNEGESATDIEWYSISNITTYKWHILKYTQLVLAYETQKWLQLQTARIHKFCTKFV